MAEGILKHKLKNIPTDSVVESAGFEPYHIGDPPDERTIYTLQQHHISLKGKKARLFKTADFDHFDKIYFMDENNLRHLKTFARNNEDLEKADYIMNVLDAKTDIEVPDPYYGGKQGFENVYLMLDKACEKIAAEIKTKTKK
jgi:protein-tyrosine phosphatase